MAVARPSGDTNSVTLAVSSLPAGITAQIQSPGAGNAGKLTFTVNGTAAGSYQAMVTASDGAATGSAALSLVVAVVAMVGNTVNTALGVNGKLEAFMSTSFQPAVWDYNFFSLHPTATTPLNNLLPQHIRLQPVDGGTPQKDSSTWDFSELDSVLDPVISVADFSPEFQIAVAPDFMRDPTTGKFLDPTYAQFAQYCANLVKYYNTTTGFTDAKGTVHVHSSNPPITPVTWWGIFNEPNINGVPASENTKMYNAVVPAMQAAGSQVPLKFVAVELADFGNEPQNFLPTFVSGVTQQVDAVATHYYSSCNQRDTDTMLFSTIPGFVDHINFFYATLKTNPKLAGVPVWVTENNVNADYNRGDGTSACNAGQPFVTDQRGTSAFFAAWRPLVLSKLAQAGARSLYHWDFDADAQFGEVDFGTGKTYLSYWVDYWLSRLYPSPPGSDILQLATTESQTVEVLATRNADGSVLVMIADHAVRSPSDNNGPGDPRTVIVDLSAWAPFSSATLLRIDANTDASTGPSPVSQSPATRIEVTLSGYGASFLTLKP